jgi:iron complex transport system substrate-binding protein
VKRVLALCAGLAVSGAAHALGIPDATGRQIELPAKVRRVYAAGPPASLLVYAIAPEKLLGWTRALRPDEAAFFPARYARLPELGRLTGRGGTANLEVLLAAHPDLIVDVGSTSATYVSLAERVQAQTGIPYALFDGRLDSIPDTLRTLGRMLGEEARARRLADYVERQLAEVRRRVATVPEAARPRVYYGRGPAGLQTGGRGSINVEVLEFLGAHNVAAGARAGLVAVPIEQVLLWDPQVILTSDVDFWRSVWGDPRWRAVGAVREQRVYLSPHLPFGWFDFPPGVNRVLGLWWAGKLLYPEALRDVDLRAKAREFYRLFYHRTPGARQLDELLEEPGVMPK